MVPISCWLLIMWVFLDLMGPQKMMDFPRKSSLFADILEVPHACKGGTLGADQV